MARHDAEPLREIMHRLLVRYLTVRPGGFELEPGGRLRTSVDARVLALGGARTRYEKRKPICRSLDGVRPMKRDDTLLCADCECRSRCTPQARLDLIIECRPYRLLLAHTSARALLVFDAELRQSGVQIEDVTTRIDVVNRGSWGELRFSLRD